MALRIIDIAIFGIVAGWALALMFMANKFRQPPWYIISVTLSYASFVIIGAYEIYLRINDPLGWRAWSYLVAGLFGLTSMAGMSHYYRPYQRQKRHALITSAATLDLLLKMTPEQRDAWFAARGVAEKR